jgi:hypothetical protein
MTGNKGRMAVIWPRTKLRIVVIAPLMIMIGLLLAACQPAAQPTAAQPVASQGQGFGGNGQRPNFQMQPAPELPTTPADVRGVVVSVNGTTLTVREGGGGFGFSGNGTPRATPNGTPRPRPTQGGGTEVQVDVSGAQVYQDVTFASLNGQLPSGTIQQKLASGSLSDISANSRVTIWGDRNGDQITAKVVVYSQIRQPGG